MVSETLVKEGDDLGLQSKGVNQEVEFVALPIAMDSSVAIDPGLEAADLEVMKDDQILDNNRDDADFAIMSPTSSVVIS